MKKSFLVVFLLLLALCVPSIANIWPGFDILRGDANNDHRVDIGDSICIQTWLYLGGFTPACMEAADVNKDGKVDISDVIFLNTYLYLGGPPPSAPFPYCGQVPEGIALTCESSSCP